MKKFYFLLVLGFSGHLFTQAQTTLVKSMRMFSYLYPVGNQLLFFGNDDADPYSSNWELWATDGTEAGTHLVKDIYPGSDGSIPDGATWDDGGGSYRPMVMGGNLYFTASAPSGIFRLFKSDGTTAGTAQVFTGVSFQGPYGYRLPEFCQLNNVLYFGAYYTGGVDGELWRTDGSVSGTYRVKDISPTASSEPTHFIAYKGAIYFAAYNENSGNELWRSDGTDAGTTIVKDFFTGEHGIMDNNNSGKVLPWMTVSGDYLYFIGNTSTDSYVPRLFRTDGTEAGTIQLNADVMPQELTDVDGTLFFFGYNTVTAERGLYKSDGTPGGTVPIPVNNNIIQFPGTYQYRTTFHAFKNKLYFAGAQVQNGANTHMGLYVSDGTTAGTALVNEMPLHYDGYFNTDFINDGANNSFLWRTLVDMPSIADYRIAQMDGTPNNYRIYYGASGNPGAAFLNGDLYFQGRDTAVSVGGSGLYKVHPSLVSAPLPVTWLGFDVFVNGASAVELAWQTANEQHNKGFSVERSADGKDFHALHWTDGAGDAVSENRYSWTDQHPLEGVSFYRIRQEDLDGRSGYSSVKQVRMEPEEAMVVAPNPVTGGTITIRHHLTPGRVQVKISDLAGRTLSIREYTVGGATLSCDVRLLGTGVYHIEIMGGNKRLSSALFLRQAP